MPITRAKATTLLNATEMGLYDDSRANALRGHTEAKLGRLVARARTARDRARDLEKRSRLALRAQTGSKGGRSGQANARGGDKAVLLADILERLEVQHKIAVKQARASAKPAKKAAATASATPRPAAKKAAVRKTSAPVAPARRTAARKTAAPTSAARKRTVTKPVAGKAAAKPSAAARPAARGTTASKAAATSRAAATTGSGAVPAPRRAAKTTMTGAISPKKALANTRRLLEQHNAEAQAPKPWQQIGDGGAAVPEPGYQSDQAASKAQELHEGQSRLPAIQGSISTRDRRNQGKRDQRG